MARNWWCAHCKKDIDTKVDPCGQPEGKHACPLWWQPASLWERLRCWWGRCSCPFGSGYCIVCLFK